MGVLFKSSDEPGDSVPQISPAAFMQSSFGIAKKIRKAEFIPTARRAALAETE
jgi:hypothetical protein